ncbi:MAG: carboxypeptidase-like regulatory domain-containing protein [Cyanobacteria bacterium P01_A01_bin.116]
MDATLADAEEEDSVRTVTTTSAPKKKHPTKDAYEPTDASLTDSAFSVSPLVGALQTPTAVESSISVLPWQPVEEAVPNVLFNRQETVEFAQPLEEQPPEEQPPEEQPLANQLLEEQSLEEQSLANQPLKNPLLEDPSAENTLSSARALSGFTVFPVGLEVGDRNSVPSTLIKGSEVSGTIAFDQWLIPFDSVMQALDIVVTPLESGDWELRSPGSRTQLSPEALQTDSDLGLVLSIDQIEALLGVPAQFEQLDYAIRFTPPWLGLNHRHRAQNDESPVITEGLPSISPDQFSISGVAQTLRLSGQGDRETQTQGSFSSLGTALGGSWYFRAEQPSLTEADSWRLSEFQYLQQTNTSDIVVGSQPTFWPSQGITPRTGPSNNNRTGGNNYWGTTYVQRWGFAPPEARGTGGFDPRGRLQAAQVGRTITGETTPGTLAQLTQGLKTTVVDEVLVDSSGLYRFENVPSSQGNGRYQVLLYPNGQLTSLPEVRAANFSSVVGQLPVGASALLVSAGVNQQRNDSFLGDFSDFQGGVAYQRGLSESLTMGVGFVQSQTPQVLAEAFYAPSSLPLKVAVSTLTDLNTDEIVVTADAQYRPSPKLYVGLNSDRLSQRFNAEWQVARGLTLLARGNTRDDAIAGGARFSWSNRKTFVAGSATLDTRGRTRWNLSSRKGALGMQHYGNEITTQSEVFYNLSGNAAYGNGHGILLNYETQNASSGFNQLGTASWQYRSEARASDGRPRWDTQLGYGIGSQGDGIVAAFTTSILPGVEVQARYQGISALSDRDSFQIEFRPRLSFHGANPNSITPANRYQDRLRTQGGLLIQPFFDENGNGRRDSAEPIYNQNLSLLLSINNEELERYRPDIERQGAFVSLAPDTYRVDLDPAGYPLNWQASQRAYAVDTAAGQFTSVEIPLTRAYTLIGTVTNSVGSAIAGQRVEAIDTDSEQRKFSITNSAGVFYLEGLSQGNYRFEISGDPVSDTQLELDQNLDGFQEINFQIFPENIQTQQAPTEITQPEITQPEITQNATTI